MSKKVLLFIFGVMLLSFVSAGNFEIKNATDTIFSAEPNQGNLTVTGAIHEFGQALSQLYLSLTGGTLEGHLILGTDYNITLQGDGAFIGDGQYLTNIVASGLADNSTRISAQNITDVPTCEAGENFLSYDGTVLTCSAVNENATVISVQNITDIPTCTGDERLFYDGSIMTCTTISAGAGVPNYTSIALTNQTVIFEHEVQFSEGLNVTRNITLNDDAAEIARDGADSTISIDSTGNVIIKLR